MANRRSKISRRHQWVLAIILIVALAAIVLWKSGMIGGIDEEDSTSEMMPSAESETPGVSVAKLTSLIEMAEASRLSGESGGGPFKAAARDPFHVPDVGSETLQDGTSGLSNSSQDGHQNEGGVDNVAEEEALGPPREEVLAGFTVSAVFRTDTWSRAVLSGRYVRVGDVVDGFMVKSILKREIVLEDEEGEEVIHLEAPPWALTGDFNETFAAPEGGSQP